MRRTFSTMPHCGLRTIAAEYLQHPGCVWSDLRFHCTQLRTTPWCAAPPATIGRPKTGCRHRPRHTTEGRGL